MHWSVDSLFDTEALEEETARIRASGGNRNNIHSDVNGVIYFQDQNLSALLQVDMLTSVLESAYVCSLL